MKSAVLITGASTGIGLDAAVALAKRGHQVFAGVRSAADESRLKELSPNINPVVLDVCAPQQITSAFDYIATRTSERISLVNNAGVAVAGPVEGLSIDDFRRQFEVNFFGLIAVTKAFLPLIRKSAGRIVNISSVAGLSSSPFLGAYSASKHALEALSDSLRWELAPFGVKVTVVEPGPIATPIWQKGFREKKRFISDLSAETMAVYGPALERFAKFVTDFEQKALPVADVTAAIVRALTAKCPPARIMVASPSRRLQHHLSGHLPQSWVDAVITKALFK